LISHGHVYRQYIDTILLKVRLITMMLYFSISVTVGLSLQVACVISATPFSLFRPASTIA